MRRAAIPNDGARATRVAAESLTLGKVAPEESGFWQGRAAGELAQRGVIYILKVGDADLAGAEAVAGEIAQKREEGRTLAERGICFRVIAERNEVQDFFLLLGRALHENAAGMVREPHESAKLSQVIQINGWTMQ